MNVIGKTDASTSLSLSLSASKAAPHRNLIAVLKPIAYLNNSENSCDVSRQRSFLPRSPPCSARRGDGLLQSTPFRKGILKAASSANPIVFPAICL